MDLIAALYTLGVFIVLLFILAVFVEILVWWYSVPKPKAKSRRDWEF